MKKIVAVFKARQVAPSSFEGAFTKFLHDPSKLGWLLKPTPAPATASNEPELCADVVEEHCRDEGYKLEAVIAGSAGGTIDDARAVLWCCLDSESADVQAALMEAEDPQCKEVHKGSREAFGDENPTFQKAKCDVAKTRLTAAKTLRAVAGGFGAIKGRMQSIGKQLRVPLKFAKTLFKQIKSFEVAVLPLLAQLANNGQKRRARHLKETFVTVVKDVESFYEQFSMLKRMATDFLQGGTGEGSIQEMLDKTKDSIIKVAVDAAEDVEDAGTALEAGEGAAAAKATADAANKIGDKVAGAVSAAKKAIYFKGAAFVAEIEVFFTHLEEFVTAFQCFVGTKKGLGCKGNEADAYEGGIVENAGIAVDTTAAEAKAKFEAIKEKVKEAFKEKLGLVYVSTE